MDSSDEEMIEILLNLSSRDDEYNAMCDLFDDGYRDEALSRALEQIDGPIKSPEMSPSHETKLVLPADCLPPEPKRRRRPRRSACHKEPATALFEELGGRYAKQLRPDPRLSRWVETSVDPDDCICSSTRASSTRRQTPRCEDCGHDRVCSQHIVECRTLDEIGRECNRANAFYQRLDTRQVIVD